MAKYLILQYPAGALIKANTHNIHMSIFTIMNNKCKLQMIDLVFAVD